MTTLISDKANSQQGILLGIKRTLHIDKGVNSPRHNNPMYAPK